jgi:hypothetical protein
MVLAMYRCCSVLPMHGAIPLCDDCGVEVHFAQWLVCLHFVLCGVTLWDGCSAVLSDGCFQCWLSHSWFQSRPGAHVADMPLLH